MSEQSTGMSVEEILHPPPTDGWERMNEKVEKAQKKLDDAKAIYAQWRAKEAALDERKNPPAEWRYCKLEEFKAELEERKATFEFERAKIELDMMSFSEFENDEWKRTCDAYDRLIKSLEETSANQISEYEEELLWNYPDFLFRPALVVRKWEEILRNTETARFIHFQLSEDVVAHSQALGSLHNVKYDWPLREDGRIDMRLAPYTWFSPCPDMDSGKLPTLRPAARRLVLELERNTARSAAYALLAGTGSGKTAALVDLGRQHWVVYLHVSEPSLCLQFPSATSLNMDSNFHQMYEDLVMHTYETDVEREMCANWKRAAQRFTAELVARLLQLLRLQRHYLEMHKTLTPWDFTVQQFSGYQGFVGYIAARLKYVDEPSLTTILKEIMKELEPLLKDSRLVVAIDNITLANNLLKARFLRPSESQEEGSTESPMSLLSPLCDTVSKLSEITRWHVVLAGNEPSFECVQMLRKDLGKLELEVVISDPADFPLLSAEQAIRLVRRLNISKKLDGMLNDLLETDPVKDVVPRMRPLRISDGKSTPLRIVNLLNNHMIGARFGLLCNAIERIVEFTENGDRDDILFDALYRSLFDHMTRLIQRMTTRLRFDKHPNCLDTPKMERAYLNDLMQICIAVKLTDGTARIQKNQELPSLGSDLVRLGLAPFAVTKFQEGEDQKERDSVEYVVCERIAVEALERFFMNDHVQHGCPSAGEHLKMLQEVSKWAKEQTTIEGNILEKLIWKRIIDLAATSSTMADLPGLPQERDPFWDEFDIISQLTTSDGSSTSADTKTDAGCADREPHNEPLITEHSTNSLIELEVPRRQLNASRQPFCSADMAADAKYVDQGLLFGSEEAKKQGLVYGSKKVEASAALDDRDASCGSAQVKLDGGHPKAELPDKPQEVSIDAASVGQEFLYGIELRSRAGSKSRPFSLTVSLHAHPQQETKKLRPLGSSTHDKSMTGPSSGKVPPPTLRMNVVLPFKSESLSQAVRKNPRDLVVDIDQSNLHLLFRKEAISDEDEAECVAKLSKLLPLATGVREGWFI